MLDLIVPHYDEPWEIGEKFFAMLDLQRACDFGQFRVILVNDGPEHALPDALFADRPYRVAQMSIPHGGVSAARNAGLEASDAEWVMFCDFDDMFGHVYALRDILGVLPAPEYDMLWMKFYAEDSLSSSKTLLHEHKENVVFIHGKLYRRQWLIDSGMRFDTSLTFNEDSCFNAVATTLLDYKRTGELKSPFGPMYIWAFREKSCTTTPGIKSDAIEGMYYRNQKVCDAYRKNLPMDRYCGMVSRTVWDAYVNLNYERLPPKLSALRDDFRAWWPSHKAAWMLTDAKTMAEVRAISLAEHKAGETEGKSRPHPADDFGAFRQDVTIEQWLKEIEAQ